MAIDKIVQGKKAAGQSKQPAEKSCMNAYSSSMNIIHSSTLGLFTNSFVKIYWLFIHPVLGLFIYSRLAAMLIHCQARRKRENQPVWL
jgi:hypothetical protein